MGGASRKKRPGFHPQASAAFWSLAAERALEGEARGDVVAMTVQPARPTGCFASAELLPCYLSGLTAICAILAAERAIENARTLHCDDHAAIEAIAAGEQSGIVDLLADRTRAANARA